jgi:hypothetical protein
MRRLFLIPLLVAAGCSCNEQDYSFPGQPAPVDGEPAPEVFGDYISMDVAPDGQRITIAYHEYDFGAVGFAVGSPGADGTITWSHERVDGYPGDDGRDPGDRGKHTSHRVAPDGTVWLAYSDMEQGGLFVSLRESGPSSWTEPETVEPGAGAWASMALDAAGVPVIAHVGSDGKSVRVTRLVDGAWATTTAYTGSGAVIPAADTGSTDEVRPAAVRHTVLQIVDGVEYLAFHDVAAGTLLLLEGTDDSWSSTTVDRGDVGAWTSMVVDAEEVWLAYQDVANQDLKVASRSGGGAFVVETVDDGELRGADTVIAVVDGNPTIAYFDGWQGDLWLASKGGGGWTTEQVAGETSAVGFHNAMVTASSGTWLATWDLPNKQASFLQLSDAESTGG